MVIALILVFMHDYTLFQIFSIMALNLIMIAYLLVYKPFTEENQRVTVCVDEIIILICVFLFLLIHHERKWSEDTRNNVGWAIIGLIIFSIVKNFLIVIHFGA